MSLLSHRLKAMQDDQPSSWSETGANARPNLHGMLRYPAMMVPSMQGDIIDAVVQSVDCQCEVIDPFVGSGTILTEALIRGLDFTGIDINPLAVLVCQAKVAIDDGADVEAGARHVVEAYRLDVAETVDVDFPGLEKWFDRPAALALSKLRRSIVSLDDVNARKVMWTLLAETIRLCSNSRTSTYKLHKRADGGTGAAVIPTFEDNVRSTLNRIAEYRSLIVDRPGPPGAQVFCGDVRNVVLESNAGKHRLLITSPPYGDNRTTIPYGQFSYLALRWIDAQDLPQTTPNLIATSHTTDTASLGGSLKEVARKSATLRGVSATLDSFLASGGSQQSEGAKKVAAFMFDFFEGIRNLRNTFPGPAHWVLTTGNRTASGAQVPFDDICAEMLRHLGARPVATVQRKLPRKRMPSKNSLGAMITAETTLVAEFA
jgi:hypothetical protein